MNINDQCSIETEFQRWLQKIRDGYGYVLCAPECAARYAFEAGFNLARQDTIEGVPVQSPNNARDEICPTPDATCGYQRKYCIRGNTENCFVAHGQTLPIA